MMEISESNEDAIQKLETMEELVRKLQEEMAETVKLQETVRKLQDEKAETDERMKIMAEKMKMLQEEKILMMAKINAMPMNVPSMASCSTIEKGCRPQIVNNVSEIANAKGAEFLDKNMYEVKRALPVRSFLAWEILRKENWTAKNELETANILFKLLDKNKSPHWRGDEVEFVRLLFSAFNHSLGWGVFNVDVEVILTHSGAKHSRLDLIIGPGGVCDEKRIYLLLEAKVVENLEEVTKAVTIARRQLYLYLCNLLSTRGSIHMLCGVIIFRKSPPGIVYYDLFLPLLLKRLSNPDGPSNETEIACGPYQTFKEQIRSGGEEARGMQSAGMKQSSDEAESVSKGNGSEDNVGRCSVDAKKVDQDKKAAQEDKSVDTRDMNGMSPNGNGEKGKQGKGRNGKNESDVKFPDGDNLPTMVLWLLRQETGALKAEDVSAYLGAIKAAINEHRTQIGEGMGRSNLPSVIPPEVVIPYVVKGRDGEEESRQLSVCAVSRKKNFGSMFSKVYDNSHSMNGRSPRSPNLYVKAWRLQIPPQMRWKDSFTEPVIISCGTADDPALLEYSLIPYAVCPREIKGLHIYAAYVLLNKLNCGQSPIVHADVRLLNLLFNMQLSEELMAELEKNEPFKFKNDVLDLQRKEANEKKETEEVSKREKGKKKVENSDKNKGKGESTDGGGKKSSSPEKKKNKKNKNKLHEFHAHQVAFWIDFDFSYGRNPSIGNIHYPAGYREVPDTVRHKDAKAGKEKKAAHDLFSFFMMFGKMYKPAQEEGTPWICADPDSIARFTAFGPCFKNTLPVPEGDWNMFLRSTFHLKDMAWEIDSGTPATSPDAS